MSKRWTDWLSVRMHAIHEQWKIQARGTPSGGQLQLWSIFDSNIPKSGTRSNSSSSEDRRRREGSVGGGHNLPRDVREEDEPGRQPSLAKEAGQGSPVLWFWSSIQTGPQACWEYFRLNSTAFFMSRLRLRVWMCVCVFWPFLFCCSPAKVPCVVCTQGSCGVVSFSCEDQLRKTYHSIFMIGGLPMPFLFDLFLFNAWGNVS